MGGCTLNENSRKNIRVLIKLCGVPVPRSYSIRTKSGQLMINRLEQILNGNLGHTHGRGDEEKYDTEVVGIIWERPYTILRELMNDCIQKQAEILKRDGHSLLTDDAICVIPEEAPDEYITKLVAYELKLRKALKRELAFLNKKC